MATIQDVARKAGVGAATVSRVLSGKGYVKEETKKKVMEAIRELNYTPNEIARNLYYKRTGIVAVIIPQISHPFFAEFIDKVVVELFAYNYKAMICNTWSEGSYELQYFDMLKRNMVDGIICGTHSITNEEYFNIDRPIVALDHTFGRGIPCVSVDHREGGRLAAMELIKAGCKNVLQFRGTSDVHSPASSRHIVFEEIIRENGLEYHEIVTDMKDLSQNTAQEVAEIFFEKYPDVDGIFGTDSIVMTVMKLAQERGVNIPGSLKVVGYDGTEISRLATPGLTTVCQPIEELAKQSVRIMMDLISGNRTNIDDVHLSVTLHRDKSTALE